MAGASWTDISNKVLSRGIDAYSAKSNIPDGYVADMENFDTNASGYVSKRKGYINDSGWIPIRISRVSRSNHNIKFQLDSSQTIDLSSTHLGPLLTYGKLHSGISTTSTNLLTTDACTWWSSPVLANTETITVGANSITKAATDHGILSNKLLVGMAWVDSDTDSSNTILIPDEVAIDTINYDVDIDLTSTNAGEAYLFIADGTASQGDRYIHTLSGVSSVSIAAATHNLSNYFILIRCYTTVGNEYIEIIPETKSIDPVTGQVDIVFDSNVTGIAILNAVPIANVSTTSANVGANYLSLVNPGSAWNFIDVYAYDTGTSTYIGVIPDNISYIASTDTISIEYTLAASSESVEIYWENASVPSNVIEVTDSTGGNETWVDSSPQVTLWGIPHTSIYRDATTRGGHVSHIDQYKRVGEARIIAGLGGNLFAQRTRTEVGSTYCMPVSYINLRSRVASDVITAPLFQSTSLSRTRGDIVDTSVVNHTVSVSAATYVSATATDYTLSFASAATLSGKVGPYDTFVITEMPYVPLNGTFKFISVSNDGSTAPVLRLNNTEGKARFDCTGTVGKAACYSDFVPLTVNNHVALLAGDVLTGEVVETAGVSTATVIDKVGDDIYIDGITSVISFPENVRVSFSSTRSVIPLRELDGTVTVENYVAGDMLSIDGQPYEVQVTRVGAGVNGFISSIVGDGTTAVVTHALAPDIKTGTKVIISGSTVTAFNGVCTVSAVNSDTEFEFASTSSATDSSGGALLVSNLLELDSEVEVDDSGTGTEVSVVGRWIPIEAPTDSYDLTKGTYIRHLDTNEYEDQPTLRSVMINDSLFLTNGEDEVLKFDGESIYRAGLFRWQPHLFSQIDTTTPSLTPITTVQAYTSINGNMFIFGTPKDAGLFNPGDRVQDTDDNAYYTVVEVKEDQGYVEVDRSITGGTPGTLTTISTFNFYFRLNAIDANNNIVASAVTSSQGDCQIEMGVAGQIKHRLVGLPAWDIYDFDVIEVETYRSKENTVAPFFRVNTVRVDFDNYKGYIDIVDGTPDYTLTAEDWDQVNSGLLGEQLGLGWNEPLRASALTSANNRLILGNISDYPKMDIVINKKASAAKVTTADLHGRIFTFRKDNSSDSTTTNMTDVVKYELIDAASATPVDIYPSTFSFVDGDVTIDTANTIAETGHGLRTGHKVRLTTTGVLPAGLSLATDYYVIRVDADTFKLASSLANAAAGTAVVISAAAGGGIHTTAPQSGISTTSSTFVINSVAHGLVAGDWIYLYHAAAGTVNDLTFAGWWQIGSVTTNTLVINCENHGRGTSGGTATDVDSYLVATTKTDIPVLIGTDGNYNNKDGNVTSTYETKAVLRLANAINASMRVCDVDVITDFEPWLVAGAGNDFSRGQLRISQPKVFSTTAAVLLPNTASATTFDIYVQGIRRSSQEEVSSSSAVFPSRVLMSYPNFPEIFNRPDILQGAAAGVVDVNAADGQAITAIITFFGESTFGASQLNDAVVVFKESSIYLLDSNSGMYQKIDSRGLGCDAPRSVAATRNGIMFANRSGIYRLNRDMTISHVGKYTQRYWKQNVNLGQLDEITGHQYGLERIYKLSVPVDDSLYCNKVLVYSHDQEGLGQEFGSWTRYSNHNATGWCNLENDAYFGDTRGSVFRLRNLGIAQDYRDKVSAISSYLTTKGDDFGLPGVRKLIGQAFLNLQLDTTDVTNLTITSSLDLKDNFSASGIVSAVRSEDPYVTAGISLPAKRGTNLSIKVSHSTVDEDVQITGLSLKIARLGSEGIKQAADY